jgi:hypothetical protein
MSRIACSFETTSMRPTKGRTTAFRPKGAERDGRRETDCQHDPRVGWAFVLTKRVRALRLIGAAA